MHFQVLWIFGSQILIVYVGHQIHVKGWTDVHVWDCGCEEVINHCAALGFGGMLETNEGLETQNETKKRLHIWQGIEEKAESQDLHGM